MYSPGYPARTVGGALLRAALRAAVFVGFGVLVLYIRSTETDVGNSRFLWGMAALMFVMAAWGVAQSFHEVWLIRARAAGRR
ncbi:MAG TPA: hypothetical protein VLB29_11760 [Nocardioidaceae bacterium]|nr:hypothetical protein [Nocardioidaceae bacterium]